MQQFKRFKLSNLRKKTSLLGSYPPPGLKRTGSTAKREDGQSTRVSSTLHTPSLLEEEGDDGEGGAGTGTGGGLSAASRTGSVYFDAEDPAIPWFVTERPQSTVPRGPPSLQLEKTSDHTAHISGRIHQWIGSVYNSPSNGIIFFPL